MALIDTYLSKINRLRKEIANYRSEISKENTKLANNKKKVLLAQQAMVKAKTQSVAKSKFDEIHRAERNQADILKKIAQIEERIVRKELELSNVMRSYQNEQRKEQNKKLELEKKQQMTSEKRFDSLVRNAISQENKYLLLREEVENLKKLPKQITILFMASNAVKDSLLNLEKEAREIQKKIRSSAHRDSIKFETRWAIRTIDILQAINETKPTIIHFSGHGSEDGSLVLLNSNDEGYKLVSKEAITATLATLADSVKLVVFNTCFSEEQAVNITKHIDIAIGMNTSISDDAAILFSSQLYSSISFGLSIEQSFKQAKASLLLENIKEENTPQLHHKNGIMPNDLVLVSKD